MKRILLILTVLLSAMMAWADVEINETNFPDENFRNHLLSLNEGTDGVLTDGEIANIQSVSVSNQKIQSLKGIEYLTALRYLYCDENKLTELDLSKNTALIYLYCVGNQLTKLDVSGCVALEDLYCYVNLLTSLDVSRCTALTSLNCCGNQLTSLDVSKNVALNVLECHENQLKVLDLSKNTTLTHLSCSSNQLASLDVSNNTALADLWCANNQLTTLDVSKCVMLYHMECEGNQLTTLDVSKCSPLAMLSCHNNKLTSLNVSGCTALTYLSCYDNQLTTLNISGCKALTELSCYKNQIKGEAMDALVESLPIVDEGRIYVVDSEDDQNEMFKGQVAAAKDKGWTVYDSSWREYEGGNEPVAINEENFPDENFRNYLLLQEYGADGVLTDDEIAEVTSMDVSNRNIQSIMGIEFFTALTYLDCCLNQLTSLNVSGCTSLGDLDCNSNQLTSLDVSGCTALTSLKCYCNQLTSLNVSGCVALEYIFCYQNQIKGAAIDAFVQSLPTCTENWGYISFINTQNDQNLMSQSQVAAVVEKHWSIRDVNGQNYEGSEEPVSEGIAINETNFPDENFRNYLLLQEYGADGVLTDDEIAEIAEINVDDNDIHNLKGIELFTALSYLSCSGNHLTSLDVSKNLMLVQLVCLDNQLTALDVSKNTALTYLLCSANQLTTLDVSNNIALTYLNCGYNQLTELNVLQNTALTELYCEYNQLKVLDVSKCREMIRLICYHNELTTIDGLSGFTSLTEIQCHENKLIALDVSGCAGLTTLRCHFNQLTTLNLSECTALNELFCFQNQIKGEGMDALVENLPIVSDGKMYVIDGLKDHNVMTNEQVAAARDKGWTVYDSGWQEYEGGNEPLAINEENFPDENFRNYLLSMYYGADGVLTDHEIENFFSLNVSGNNIRNLKGIELFPALTFLECSGNQLTEFDVSKNTALTYLDCSGNQLTAIDVSKNTALTYLSCTKNPLTTLDLSQNFALESLLCSENLLTSLDLSNNTALTYLQCDRNQLTSLDLSGCTALSQLICGGNQMTSIDVTKNIALETLSCDNNQLTTLDVTKNTKLMGLSCEKNQLTSLDMSKNIALETLSCSENQLTTLDLSKNTKLLGLNCEKNQMTRLDISKNIALEYLYCGYNELTTIGNVSGLTTIEVIDCRVNQISTLDVSGCTGLSYLNCYSNQMSSLNVSGCTGLTTLSCWNNYLTSLNVSDCIALQELTCFSNRLTELNLSGLSALHKLDCSHNHLTALNISGCSALTSLDINRNYIMWAAMEALVKNLPFVREGGWMGVIQIDSDHNVMTKSQVSAARAKGWKIEQLVHDKNTYAILIWQEYEGSGSEPVVVDEETTVKPSDTAEAGKATTTRSGVTTSLGSEDVVDAAEGSVTMTSSMTTDALLDLIMEVEPSSSDFAKQFKGFYFLLAAGKGTVEFDIKTTGGYSLGVMKGSEFIGLFTRNTKGTVTIPYDLEDDTWFFAYPVAGSSASANRAADAGGALKIYGLRIIPETQSDGINNLIPAFTKGNGAVYNLQGQQLQTLQKGINIIDGKKVIVK